MKSYSRHVKLEVYRFFEGGDIIVSPKARNVIREVLGTSTIDTCDVCVVIDTRFMAKGRDEKLNSNQQFSG